MKKAKIHRTKLPKFATKKEILAAKRKALNMAKRIKQRKAQL
jgi:hypothetical protein